VGVEGVHWESAVAKVDWVGVMVVADIRFSGSGMLVLLS
jgi:hypothetical protein